MISRQLTNTLIRRLARSPAVALLGSRQVGKTTLARDLDFEKPTHYLDLERPSDLAKLADPELYLFLTCSKGCIWYARSRRGRAMPASAW